MSSLISPEQERRILEIQGKLGIPVKDDRNASLGMNVMTIEKLIELAEKALNDGNIPPDFVEQWGKSL